MYLFPTEMLLFNATRPKWGSLVNHSARDVRLSAALLIRDLASSRAFLVTLSTNLSNSFILPSAGVTREIKALVASSCLQALMLAAKPDSSEEELRVLLQSIFHLIENCPENVEVLLSAAFFGALAALSQQPLVRLDCLQILALCARTEKEEVFSQIGSNQLLDVLRLTDNSSEMEIKSIADLVFSGTEAYATISIVSSCSDS